MIGDNIKKFRKTKKLTQEELGKRLGVSAAMISQWERGERNPRTENLQKIASALDVTMGELTDLIKLPFQYNIIYARRSSGLTIKELSAKTGIAEDRLKDLEDGVELPTNEEIEKIGEKTEVYSFIINPIKAPDYAIEATKNLIETALSRNTRHLIKNFESLNTKGQEKALESLELLLKIPEYKKAP